jgi:hypothetical protein
MSTELSKKEEHDISGVKFKYEKGKPYVTIRIEKDQRRIKKTDLWMLVFMMSKGKQQDDLIPVWEKDMIQFTRQHKVRATKDIKAGEMVEFHCDVNVPKIVVDSLLKKEGIEDPNTVIKPMEKVIPTPGTLQKKVESL